MKLSVIFGVSHMTLGILIKGSNNIFARNYIEFFFEFIPQLLFLLATFGYMCFLIFLKWLQDYSKDVSKAPSILSIMINFGMDFGGVEIDDVLLGSQ